MLDWEDIKQLIQDYLMTKGINEQWTIDIELI